jgi:hemerythrin superfamily protein
MNEQTSILSLMVKDHEEIETLIKKLDESIDKEYEMMRKTFEQFEWKLEKHLFIEEKAIFTFYEPTDISNGYVMLPILMKQHNFILNTLAIMRRQVNNGKAPQDHLQLRSFLQKHKNYEEKEVYPRLDDALNNAQKKQIIDRIQEFS